MHTWFVWICQQVTANPGGMVALICATLTVVLLALIALGFGPLRSWLSRSPAPQSPPERSTGVPEGLWSMWRLYREVERAGNGQR